MDTPGRTTILEAVNVMLATIGEQPVNSLAPPSQQITEAVVAQKMLLEKHKAGQQQGWAWNTDRDYPFARDASTGEVSLPVTAARVVIDQGRHTDLVARGLRVWNSKRFTYQLDEPSVAATVVWFLPWDECPEAYNRWTLIRAGRVFCARFVGEVNGVQFAAVDEDAAFTELQRVETQQARPNVLTGAARFPTFRPRDGMGSRLIGGGSWL